MNKDRITQALSHLSKLERDYQKEIAYGIENTTVWGLSGAIPTPLSGVFEKEITVVDLDSVAAVFAVGENPAVLNFADWFKPGGRFLEGAFAQEEALCHSSTLYPVLKAADYYYEENKKLGDNKSLYRNRALISDGIVFFDGDKTKSATVVTCAAPNKKMALTATEKENYAVLESRIKFVCSLLNELDNKTVVLGAFGCGVFRQDPTEVAELFQKHLKGVKDKEILFAIPIRKNKENFSAFQKVFQK